MILLDLIATIILSVANLLKNIKLYPNLFLVAQSHAIKAGDKDRKK